MMDFKLTGLDKLIENLEAVSSNVTQDLRKAVVAGAVVVRKSARAKIRNRSGTLSRSIRIRSTKQGMGTVIARIGPTGKGWYGSLVEEGHNVKVKRRGKVIGYAPPHRFLQPALDEKRGEAEQKIKDKLIESIQKAVK